MKLHGVDFTNVNFAAQEKLLADRQVGVILDVGANVGNTVAVYAEMFPAARVYAFEPFPTTYEKLADRFRDNPRVHPFNLAAGCRRENGTLYVNEYVDTNSLLPRPVSGRRYYGSENLPQGMVPVDVVTLDEFAEEHGLQHINILKLDIQGGEGNALSGAGTLLQDCRVDLIFSEVFFVPHYQGALLFHELTERLAGFGYSLFDLCHLTWGRNGQLRFADALYVSPGIRRTVIDAWAPER
jgi:FkbM family methyltransferase